MEQSEGSSEPKPIESNRSLEDIRGNLALISSVLGKKQHQIWCMEADLENTMIQFNKMLLELDECQRRIGGEATNVP